MREGVAPPTTRVWGNTPEKYLKFCVKWGKITLFSFRANCNFDPDFWSQMVS